LTAAFCAACSARCLRLVRNDRKGANCFAIEVPNRIRLNQHRYQATQIVNTGSVGEISQSLIPLSTDSYFQIC